MKQQTNYGGLKQQGIALPIIMVILVLAALVTIYTTTTSVKEQQVTADQYRSEQAFSTAQAGVDVALERHNNFESFTLNGCDPAVAVPPETNITSDCTGFSGSEKGSFEVMFCDIWDEDGVGKSSELLMQEFLTDKLICTNPLSAEAEADGFSNDERVGILSVGKPDDASGRRTISVVSAPGFTIDRDDGVFPPLSARGNSGITGNITVFNRYKNLTLWLGADLDFGSAAVSTLINDGSLEQNFPDYEENGGSLSADDYRLAMMDPLTTPSPTNAQVASDNIVGQNSDALTGDTNLENLSEEDLFEGVFLRDIDTVRRMAVASGQYFTDVNVLEAETRTGLIWLEVSDDVSLKNPIGSFDEPAFLIVEFTDRTNELTITANATIYGAVFIFGQLSFNGGPVVYGGVVATGSVVGGAGGGTIVYDPASLETGPEGLAGLRGIESGTWKDWGHVN